MTDGVRRAVVVEDDAETRRFVVRALEEEGLEVRSAGRAAGARGLLLEFAADVVTKWLAERFPTMPPKP